VTALDYVVAALKEIGVLAAGEDAEANDAADALSALNRLLDQWAVERLNIYTIVRTTVPIVSGTGTYSIVGTATQPRPAFLDHVGYIDTSTDPDSEYLLQPITEDGWAGIAQKGLTGSIPSSWYYNPTFPNGTLTLYPAPTSATLQAVLYYPQAVAKLATLATTVSLPPGYERMLVKNLALELLPSYSRQADPALVQQAMEAKAAIKRINQRARDMSFGGVFGSGRGWSIYEGP